MILPLRFPLASVFPGQPSFRLEAASPASWPHKHPDAAFLPQEVFVAIRLLLDQHDLLLDAVIQGLILDPQEQLSRVLAPALSLL